MSAGKTSALDRVKRDLSIVTLARRLGLSPRRESRGRHVLRCPNPAHDDKRPSCVLFENGSAPDRFCCRSCGAGGTVVDLYALVAGVSMPDACRALVRGFGVGS